jgi:regulator of replication initiation timing
MLWRNRSHHAVKQEAQPELLSSPPTFQCLCGRGLCPAFRFPHLLACTTCIHLPCAFVVMLDMMAHSENKWKVRKELMHIFVNEAFDEILETIVRGIKKASDGSDHIKQLYDEAQPYIPAVKLYEKEYWIAAYIIYSNLTKFNEMINQLNEIESSITKLREESSQLWSLQVIIKDSIEILREDLQKVNDDYQVDDLKQEIKNYQEELRSIKGTYKEILDRCSELEDKKRNLIRGIIQFAKQLVVS